MVLFLILFFLLIIGSSLWLLCCIVYIGNYLSSLKKKKIKLGLFVLFFKFKYSSFSLPHPHTQKKKIKKIKQNKRRVDIPDSYGEILYPKIGSKNQRFKSFSAHNPTTTILCQRILVLRVDYCFEPLHCIF